MDALKNILRIITVLLLLTGTFEDTGSRLPTAVDTSAIVDRTTVEIIISESRIADGLRIRLVVEDSKTADTLIEIAKAE